MAKIWHTSWVSCYNNKVKWTSCRLKSPKKNQLWRRRLYAKTITLTVVFIDYFDHIVIKLYKVNPMIILYITLEMLMIQFLNIQRFLEKTCMTRIGQHIQGCMSALVSNGHFDEIIIVDCIGIFSGAASGKMSTKRQYFRFRERRFY